ncbi:MAG: cation:proton antiporter [Jiangellales bacterium]
MVDTGDVLYLVAGVGLLLAAALPGLARGRAFSAPMLFLLLGVAVGLLPIDVPPLIVGAEATEQARAWTERITEVVVIVALFGVGLAIDRPFSLRGWSSTWRMLVVVMPLSIAGVAVTGWWLAGLVPAAALLLGAVLAPTDPVLASEVQVGEPSDESDGDEDEVRFALTSEAGLNDGLAFPFVYAAIFLVTAGVAEWGLRWVAWELVGKTVVGAAVGALIGYLIARLAFARAARVLRFAETAEALVALAAVALAYGAAESLQGYGFVAVFVAALVLRGYERTHEFHSVMHRFIEQIERLLTLGVLLALGYASVHGLFDALTWQAAAVGVLLVVAIRPLVGWLSLLGSSMSGSQRLAVAFFGVRGIGSFYYLAYAAGQATFEGLDVLWATVGFTVVLSVVVHGVAAGPAMEWVDRRTAAAPPAGRGKAD